MALLMGWERRRWVPQCPASVRGVHLLIGGLATAAPIHLGSQWLEELLAKHRDSLEPWSPQKSVESAVSFSSHLCSCSSEKVHEAHAGRPGAQCAPGRRGRAEVPRLAQSSWQRHSRELWETWRTLLNMVSTMCHVLPCHGATRNDTATGPGCHLCCKTSRRDRKPELELSHFLWLW